MSKIAPHSFSLLPELGVFPGEFFEGHHFYFSSSAIQGSVA